MVLPQKKKSNWAVSLLCLPYVAFTFLLVHCHKNCSFAAQRLSCRYIWVSKSVSMLAARFLACTNTQQPWHCVELILVSSSLPPVTWHHHPKVWSKAEKELYTVITNLYNVFVLFDPHGCANLQLNTIKSPSMIQNTCIEKNWTMEQYFYILTTELV